jgi:hypothetical protein
VSAVEALIQSEHQFLFFENDTTVRKALVPKIVYDDQTDRKSPMILTPNSNFFFVWNIALLI